MVSPFDILFLNVFYPAPSVGRSFKRKLLSDIKKFVVGRVDQKEFKGGKKGIIRISRGGMV